MTKKMDLKAYTSSRVYVRMAGTLNISKLYVWDKNKGQYFPPKRGKLYLARRSEADAFGNKKRGTAYFETIEEARSWQAKLPPIEIEELEFAKGRYGFASKDLFGVNTGPLFSEILQEWQSRMYPRYSKSTQYEYDKLIRLNFNPLLKIPIRSVTSSVLDKWIDWLRTSLDRSFQAKQRQFFTHELRLLSTVLNYYSEYHEDREFQNPVKRRHRAAVKLRRDFKQVPKDLIVEEFLKFRDELFKQPHGKVFGAMATVQYFQALRISEAAALHYEDVVFDDAPQKSRLRIVRHVVWIRKKGVDSFIEGGFKNAKCNGGIKEQPLFPESYKSLCEIQKQEARYTGLIFRNKEEQFFEFRQIQHAYDKAFKSAGLPYRGTHVLRHGGTRHVFNKTADIAIAQQILGNTSLESTLVYAKRNTNALNDFAAKEWNAVG